jgi:hypothetical protein
MDEGEASEGDEREWGGGGVRAVDHDDAPSDRSSCPTPPLRPTNQQSAKRSGGENAMTDG